MRSRHVLTAVGEAELLRPWYLCPQCHHGQFPADASLDIEKTGLSPGVLTTSEDGHFYLSGDKETLSLRFRANAGAGWL
jgi:hypothetical protein